MAGTFNITNIDCIKGLKEISDKQVDLTVTSPPYDNLRDYQGISWNSIVWKEVLQQIYRVTKDGGVLVWIVGDSVVNGSETGTSFEQALYAKEIGFNLHDTMIYAKDSFAFPMNTRYHQVFEYMFILSKGKPKTFNMIKDRLNKSVGCKLSSTDRQKDGSLSVVDFSKRNNKEIKEYGGRFNIWEYKIGRGKIGDYSTHPAPFPEKLAEDHIISWSNEGDTVLDPFCGSGTTGKMAVINNRNFIGFDLSSDYCEIASTRIKKALL